MLLKEKEKTKQNKKRRTNNNALCNDCLIPLQYQKVIPPIAEALTIHHKGVACLVELMFPIGCTKKQRKIEGKKFYIFFFIFC